MDSLKDLDGRHAQVRTVRSGCGHDALPVYKPPGDVCNVKLPRFVRRPSGVKTSPPLWGFNWPGCSQMLEQLPGGWAAVF
jgi:hypothetical protein